MKHTMNMMQRVLLAGILPERATFEVGIIIQDIRKKLAITQDEVTRTGLRTLPGGGLQWDTAKERKTDVEFTDAEHNIVAGALKKASDDNNLPTDPAMIELYRSFVTNPPPANKTRTGK